jgi:hypothetical protein
MCHFFGQQKSKKIASLTMSLPVKYVLSVLIRALRRARHFALVEDVPIQPRLARNPFRSETQFDPCISSVTTAIMITTSNSPREEGAGYPLNSSMFYCTP